ncbi:putative N-acetyltransferase YhbS [Gracilibacillus alcaliphilus]|nr:putative N-acetyltransferase YhbS [Gracilibacillus alcaliphilus]
MHEQHSDHSEHQLVHRLRESEAFIPELSLVAVDNSESVIGHILLTKISIDCKNRISPSLALAPVSVLPAYQYQGIGSQLIQAALKQARELGHSSVIVLGHPDYYPKFGFRKASEWQIKAPFDVPDETFMAIELTDGSLRNIQGTVRYSAAFDQ